MTANLHISQESKKSLDEMIPRKINGESITYDDYIQATLWFFTNQLNFGQHDIIDLITSYKIEKLRQSKSDSNVT